MMSAKECQYNQKELALQVEEYLQMGVGALEIFTRYVRNINLQTLQTPNYDLQTNVCVEKSFAGVQPLFASVYEKTDDTARGI